MLHPGSLFRFLLIAVALLVLFGTAEAQTNQTVTNGDTTSTVKFSGAGCMYNWVNDNPSIGLPANGIGDIASFTAINTGNIPVTAHIIATPIQTEYAYIANTGSNTVNVISTATNTVISTITVGSEPAGVCVSPDGSKVYVTNTLSRSVSVINTLTNQVTATIPVGAYPYSVVFSPDGNKAFVANDSDGTISVINTAINKVIAIIPVGKNTLYVTISPDGSKLYVTDYFDNLFYAIDVSTYTIIATIKIPSAFGLAVSPDGSKIYAGSYTTAYVYVIDANTLTVTANIKVDPYPLALVVSPDGKSIYTSNSYSNDVSIINLLTSTVTASVLVQFQPQTISVTSDGTTLYVLNSASNSVSVINLSTYKIVASVPVGEPLSFGNFITPAKNCNSPTIKFNITVNPQSILPPAILASQAFGTISACQGNASESPNIEQFPVSGSNLIGNITATAPANFEVSLNPNTGYNASISIPETGGNVNNVPVYVRSAASDAAGKISGKVVLSSPGATDEYIAVTGVVNPQPSVTVQPPSQELASGATTQAINFKGTANTFTWTNDTPSIGLPAGGTGNIPAFTAINTTSSKVTATLTVVPQQIGYAYITNQQANTVSVINTATNVVVKTIPVGQTPTGIAISADGTKVYITNQRSNTISVISTLTNQVVSTIQLTNISSPTGIAVSPDGASLYVVNLGSNSISVINAASGNVTSTFAVGGYPVGIVVSPDGSNVFVTNSSDNISDINLLKRNVATIPVAKGPYDICISSDGGTLYVTNSGGSTVSVINASSGAVTAAIPVGTTPEGLAISADGGTLYVVNETSGNVSVINTATNKVTATIAVGTQPVGVSVTTDGGFVYVTNQGSNSVSVISTASNSVVASIPVGTGPESLGNFILSGSGCTGSPATFTITVDPTLLAPTITSGTVSGNISACEGAASASPYLEQFTVSGNNLNSDITIVSPANFEISLSATESYSNNITLSQLGGIVNNTVIYVRSAAKDQPNNISGSILLTSTGAVTQTVPVSGVVNSLPVVNNVVNQTVNNGNLTKGVNFSGTAAAYDWTNDTPSIGLAASGTGNIPSFKATNLTNIPLKATITVTPIPAQGSIKGRAYITNSVSSISVIDIATNNVIATVPVMVSPLGVTVSPDNTRVYVTNQSSGVISVIDVKTNTVLKNITVSQGDNPSGIAISPDGTKLYVVEYQGNTVDIFNTTDYSLAGTLPIKNYCYGICLSPDGNKIYVTNIVANNVSVFDAATRSLQATIAVGNQPNGIVVSPDGKFLFTANSYSNDISVINIASNTFIGNINTSGSSPYGICISPDGNTIYVSNVSSANISVINAVTKSIEAIIPVGDNPEGLSITPDGAEVYVSNNGSSSVSVIDCKTNKVTANIGVGYGPISFGNFITGATGNSCDGVPGTFIITVEPSASNIAQTLVIPNTFTPNGDGINDTWQIKSLENYPNCTVEIYNRWGEKLYSSVGYSIPWDGTYKGTNLPVGTYYYIINLKNGVNAISGWVAIIK